MNVQNSQTAQTNYQDRFNLQQRLASWASYLSSVEESVLVANQKRLAFSLSCLLRHAPPNFRIPSSLGNILIDRCRPIPMTKISKLQHLIKKFKISFVNSIDQSHTVLQKQQQTWQMASNQGTHEECELIIGCQSKIDFQVNNIFNNGFQSHQTNQCLGCQRLFQENQQVTQTGQSYLLMNYRRCLPQTPYQTQQMEQELRRSICSLLNSGGGYLLIHQGLSQKLEGINMQKQELQTVMSNIESNSACIFPQSFYINFQQVPTTKTNKTILRITITPHLKGMVFLQKKVYPGGTKITYSLQVKHNKSIKDLPMKQAYSFFHQMHKLGIKLQNARLCLNIGCVGSESLVGSLLSGYQLLEEQKFNLNLQLPTSYVIIFPSSKHESLAQQMRANLTQKGIHFKLTKLHFKNGQNSMRQIWCLNSAQKKLQEIRKILPKPDGDRKYSIVVATRFLQIKGEYNDQLADLQTEMANIFGVQAQQASWQENEEDRYKVLSLPEMQHSIFAYWFLDNLQVRLEFVRETNFQTGAKKRKTK